MPFTAPSGRRPFGVSVIILMMILYVSLMAAAIFLSWGEEIDVADFWLLDINDSNLVRTLFLAITLLELVIAIGLWRLQRWAWTLLMIQVGLGMAADLWGYFHANPSYLTMLINVIIVFYLNQREVQRPFKARGSAWTT